ncbi:MAG: hypothetical protein CBE00_12965 [Planctomycetaceae bacterium TMED240]|nr:hypothetical protein [Rhodopirellula sp.]OUX04246.1 MAG: hypothetical protein CBE00_12965 [Planctomycetaceae bacterium TMED240]
MVASRPNDLGQNWLTSIVLNECSLSGDEQRGEVNLETLGGRPSGGIDAIDDCLADPVFGCLVVSFEGIAQAVKLNADIKKVI